jgi:hypothetical protein
LTPCASPFLERLLPHSQKWSYSPAPVVLVMVRLRLRGQTFDLRAVGVYLVASVVEPQDALRGVFDRYEVALALAQRGERQTQRDAQQEPHVLCGFNVEHPPSILSSIARHWSLCYLESRGSERFTHVYETDGSVGSYRLYIVSAVGSRYMMVYKEQD